MAALIYVHDPMCSWCWGFTNVYDQLIERLPAEVEIHRLVGGLAPDSDAPMPEPMRQMLQQTWARIEQMIPAKKFNFDFWSQCEPRRSTYPACRAVIASKMQQSLIEKEMILAIQQAYYLDAKNPSNEDVLIQLAANIGLNADTFIRDFKSKTCHDRLERELLLTRKLYVSSFPALVLSNGTVDTVIHIDYSNSDHILKQIF